PPRSSAASPDATCGRDANPIARRRHAISAIPISSALTGRAAASSPPPTRSPVRSPPNGPPPRRTGALSYARAASRCCSSIAARGQHARGGSLLPRASALAPVAAIAQDPRHPLTRMEVSYRFGFDAAHHFNLDVFPQGHPYRGIHGHSFQVEVAIAGAPDPATGFVADFGAIATACAEVREDLDHRML